MANSVLIGIFDGVHQGHQELLRIAQSKGEVTALTFYPHPTSVFAPERIPSELIPLKDRIELLKKHGASHVEVIEFTKEFSNLSPAMFLQEGLITVLLALLSNEEATIQNYACTILANILAWERQFRWIEYCSSSRTRSPRHTVAFLVCPLRCHIIQRVAAS